MTSKRTVIFAILFAAAIVSWALIERYGTTETTPAPAVVSEVAPPRQPIQVTDSDNDGIPDWQEAVLSTKTTIRQSTSTAVQGPLTLTDQVSREFFVDFVETTYGDRTMPYSNEQYAALAIDSLVAQGQDTPLTINDVRIAATESNDSLKIYGDRIALIIEQYSEDSQNELQILNNALRVQNPDLLKALDPKIAAYDAFYRETLNVTVPPSLANEHVDLLNSYASLRNDLAGFSKVFSDPVLTLTRMQDYQVHVVEMASALTIIYGKIIEAGVSISQDDPSFAIINVLGQQ